VTPFVLGVAGGTSSGKTTVCRRLAEELGAACLHITHDAYYRSLPAHLRANPVGYNFDHPDALDTERLIADLDRLRAGQATPLPEYNMAHHHRMVDGPPVAPRPVLLVEGILVLASDALARRFDLSVFVDAPADIRLMRRVRRDVAERGRQPLDVLEQYERTVRPMHEEFVQPSAARASLTLSGTAPVASLVRALLDRIPVAR
jgi:uridine kinase